MMNPKTFGNILMLCGSVLLALPVLWFFSFCCQETTRGQALAILLLGLGMFIMGWKAWSKG